MEVEVEVEDDSLNSQLGPEQRQSAVHWTMRCIFRPRAKIRIIGGDNQLRVFLPPGFAYF